MVIEGHNSFSIFHQSRDSSAFPNVYRIHFIPINFVQNWKLFSAGPSEKVSQPRPCFWTKMGSPQRASRRLRFLIIEPNNTTKRQSFLRFLHKLNSLFGIFLKTSLESSTFHSQFSFFVAHK